MSTVGVAAAAIALTADTASVVIPLAVFLAAGGLVTNPAVNARVFGILGEARTLGGALNIAAFNVGTVIAPWIAGLVIDAGPGLAPTRTVEERPKPTVREGFTLVRMR